MSQPAQQIRLDHRAVVAVSGAEAKPFLQNIVTNDVRAVQPGQAIYSALLTPQGKYAFDFFICEADGALLLDVEAERRDGFVFKLKQYRLRAKVEIEDRLDAMTVWAIIGDAAARLPAGDPGTASERGGGVVYRDPRLAEMGWRAILPAGADPGFRAGTLQDYDRVRLTLGVPDASRDIVPEKTLALEANLAELHGVDFNKGCYVGQELTARTKHRGKVRKRLLPVTVEGGAPEPGTPVLKDGKDVGRIGSAAGERAIALLRLDDVSRGAALTAGGRPVTALQPAWLDERLRPDIS